ncbi:MAG TPA: DUF423 domain-containing protein [Myxococcota bacterium]|nr:DUF423 domain-containing protein [Myxococcota bacterium]
MTARLTTLAAPLGALLTGLAVAMGAFGAHGLKSRLTEQQLGWWHTAASYHLAHGLALLALGLFLRVAPPSRPRAITAALWLLLLGFVLFSGSLYTMALTDLRALGAVTPFGGTSWLIAWGLLGWALWPRRPA